VPFFWGVGGGFFFFFFFGGFFLGGGGVVGGLGGGLVCGGGGCFWVGFGLSFFFLFIERFSINFYWLSLFSFRLFQAAASLWFSFLLTGIRGVPACLHSRACEDA